jgi:hypothetical protein
MDVKIEYDRDKTGHYGNYTDKRSKKKKGLQKGENRSSCIHIISP